MLRYIGLYHERIDRLQRIADIEEVEHIVTSLGGDGSDGRESVGSIGCDDYRRACYECVGIEQGAHTLKRFLRVESPDFDKFSAAVA